MSTHPHPGLPPEGEGENGSKCGRQQDARSHPDLFPEGAEISSSPPLARYADRAANWAVIALGFSIPISVALDNVLLAVALAGWLAGGNYKNKLLIIKDNYISAAALVLFALLLAGTLYGDRGAGDAANYLGKYADLLFIPIFLFLFRDPATRRTALRAFAASLLLVLVLSYLTKAGLVPKNPLTMGTPDYPVVFKLHLTHNILMAYAAFLFTSLALTASSAKVRLGWAILAVLAALNVTMMVQGATGYLVFFGLALLVGFDRYGWRGLGLAAILITLFAGALTLVPGPFRERVDLITKEIRGWRTDRPAHSSAGLRLEFYRNTLAIIAEHPVIGVGTGGLPKAYAGKTQGTGVTETRNPHNEFLNITVQIGLIGLAALLSLFYVQWRHATHIGSPFERHLARGLVLTMVVGCMFNSLLLDHTEGLLYAWLTGLLYAGVESGKKGNGEWRVGSGE